MVPAERRLRPRGFPRSLILESHVFEERNSEVKSNVQGAAPQCSGERVRFAHRGPGLAPQWRWGPRYSQSVWEGAPRLQRSGSRGKGKRQHPEVRGGSGAGAELRAGGATHRSASPLVCGHRPGARPRSSACVRATHGSRPRREGPLVPERRPPQYLHMEISSMLSVKGKVCDGFALCTSPTLGLGPGFEGHLQPCTICDRQSATS